MDQSKSIQSLFYEDIPVISESENEAPDLSIDLLASVCMEAVYILDFHKRSFH